MNKQRKNNVIKVIQKSTSLIVVVALTFSILSPAVYAQSQNSGALNRTVNLVGEAVGVSAGRALTSGNVDAFEESLKDIAGNVLECSIDKILSQGLKGILNGLGQKLFGGAAEGALGGAIGNIGKGITGAVESAVGNVAGEALGGIAGSAAGGALGGFGAALGLGGQAVPVNTISINPEIKAITAKEVGSVTGGGIFQTPSLDSIAYCLANSVIQYSAEGAASWMATANKGNETFVTNYERHYRDIQNQETRQVLNDLAASNLCAPHKRQIIRSVAREASGQHKFYDQRCQIDQVQNYDAYIQGGFVPNSLNAYIAQNSPDSNRLLLQVLAEAEAERQRASAVNIADKELRDHGGNIGLKDATGSLIEHPTLAYEQARDRMGLIEDRLAAADEMGKILDQLMQKIFFISPGGLLSQKLINNALRSTRTGTLDASSVTDGPIILP